MKPSILDTARRLKELSAKATKATAYGPSRYHSGVFPHGFVVGEWPEEFEIKSCGEFKKAEDAEFHAQVCSSIDSLCDALIEARDALEYYSHPDHYEGRVTLAGNRGPGVLRERGAFARAWIEKFGGGKC